MLACVGLSVATFSLVLLLLNFPSAFDRPIAHALNAGAANRPVLDLIAAAVVDRYALSGVIFLAALWYCWFSSTPAMRGRVLNGTAAAVAAGMVSRIAQHKLPSHPRPLHDASLGFHPPPIVDPNSLNVWNAFPSDHAAVWFGLAMVVFIARPGLGILALLWAFVTDLGRVYLGYHYPTDIVGGAALGCLCVGVSQLDLLQRPARAVVRWSERHPPVFYALAFFASHQVATLFDDLRQVGRGVANLFHLPMI